MTLGLRTIVVFACRWLVSRLPWSFADWLTRRYGLCWAGMVNLKLYGPEREECVDAPLLPRPSRTCFAGREVGDYCGLYGPEHAMHRAESIYRAVMLHTEERS